MSRLTEVDKLLAKIDSIYNDLGGEADPNFFDTSKVKDKYERLRVEINRNIGEVEALLNSKESLTTNDKIQEKYIIDGKIEEKMEVLNKQLKELDLEIQSKQKKSANKEESQNKQMLLENFNKRYLMIKNRHEGVIVDDYEMKENVAQIEQLEMQIMKQTGGPQRELYKEEKDKMEEWDKRIEKQDEGLRQIHLGVKELKVDAREIGREINNVGKAVDNTKKHADVTTQKLETTNKKLKDMLEKLRGSDKICLDIVLICICLGLAAVLYNLIKNKISSG